MISNNRTKREKKRIRVRKKISGTSEKPRLAVYRSLTQIYAQIIDDSKGVTLVSASSLDKEIAEEIKKVKGKIGAGKIVGSLIAKKASEKDIKTVVFDRSGYAYHGRVKAIADGARDGGLKI